MNKVKKFPSLRTLVIDDGELSCAQLSAILHKNSYEYIVIAHNVSAGLRMVKIHKPDVIFLSTLLLNKSELGVIPEIRKILPAVSVLMMSRVDANDRYTNDLLTNSIKYGANGFIFKPFNGVSIVGVMEKIAEKFNMVQAA